MTRPHAWWKSTNDTLISYLSLDETRRMLASSSALAPAAWQEKARKTLGERLGRLVKGTLRTGYSVATLGLSEVMFRLSKSGPLTGNEDVPALDLVVGPTEAALLIVDGAVSSVLTSERLATRTFWERLDTMLGRGPHLEVVMIDRAPFSVTIPLNFTLGGQEIRAQVDATMSFGLEGADRVLDLLARGGTSIEGASLSASEGRGEQASFVTSAGLTERVQRRLEHRVPRMEFASHGTKSLYQDLSVLHMAEREVQSFLVDELDRFGMNVESCQLLLGRTEEQQLAIDRRRVELDRERAEMLAERGIQEERRQALFEAERATLEKERKTTEAATGAELAGIGETNRFALARMVMLDEHQLSQIEREGFAEKRKSERNEELLDFKQNQLVLRERRAQELEGDLAKAESQLDIGRIELQLERERLAIAALAQEQNLANLRQLKEIEREDDLLRQGAQTEAERHRLAAAKDLTPEQMMAALADRDPEIARALAARGTSEAEFAKKSAADQIALMKEMQAHMASMMEKGLDANARVASGMLNVARTQNLRAATPANQGVVATNCSSCGEAVEPTWNVCPFCSSQQA